MPLNTTSSIVDLLRSRSLPTDLGFRSQLYESLGLGTRDQFMSGARTTGSTNVQLLQRLSQNPSLIDTISGAVRAGTGLQGLRLPQAGGSVNPAPGQGQGQNVQQAAAQGLTLPSTVEGINAFQSGSGTFSDDFGAFSDSLLQSYQQSQSTLDELLKKYVSSEQPTLQDFIANENTVREQTGLGAIEKEYADYLAKLSQVERDIRNEVAASGGTVTESQVKSLAAERTKALQPRAQELETQLNLKTKLAERIASEYNLSQREAQQRAGQMLTTYMSVQEKKQEQATKLASQVAPSLYQQSGGDAQKLQSLVSGYSSRYGVDPSLLYSSALAYKTDYEKQAILNASQTASLLAQTSEGGELDVPGIGKVQILGKRDQKPDTINAGGKVYQWSGGKWVDTGLPADTLTPANIISALQSLANVTNPGIAGTFRSVLKQYGVDVPLSSGATVAIPANTLAGQNNNPGNLKYVGQEGATLGQGGFARFNTPEEGYQALVRQIQLDQSRDLTVSAFVNKYAPPSENDTQTYIRQLTEALSVAPNSKIKNIDTQQLAAFIARKESGTTVGLDSSQQAISDGVRVLSSKLTSDQAKSLSQSVNMLLQRGDVQGARENILSTAINALPAEQRNAAFGRVQAIEALQNLTSLLGQYRQAGGNTGLLRGTQEQIAQKLGSTTNPQLAYIGNLITLALIDYRKSVSGAAFTESELKQYESVFPNIKKSFQLNETKVKSLMDTFNRNQKLTLQLLVGATNYDKIYAGSYTSTGQPSQGGTRVVNGKTYYRHADGRYYTSPE